MALADSKLKSHPLWQRAAAFGGAYFFCAEAGSYLSAQGGTSVSFWLPAGLFLAVLLLSRIRDWPWLALAVLPANYLFDILHDPKPNMAAIFFFYGANVTQAMTGAWLIRRFVTERPTLATLKEFVGLVGFAAILSTMLGAVIGAATLVHFGLSQSFEQSWKVWWGSTMMAILVLTPFILTWFSKPGGTHNDFGPPKKIAEAILLLLGLSGCVWYLLAVDKGVMSPNKSLVIPFLLWSGLRFGVRGATAASLFLSLTLAFFTAQFFIGLTPAQIASGEYVFVLQILLAISTSVAVIPAIVLGERAEAQAREAQARAEYTLQLIASQEAERTRIARELHDSLGQNLLLIKNRVQLEMDGTSLPADLREQLQNISDITSQAIAEVRQISHDLHPPQLELLGLARALGALIDNTRESGKVAIDWKFDSVDDLFPREAATNVYRIVQESLNNILRHSGAKKARVTLERDVHEVLLKIEDDGCGLKTGKDGGGGKGLGLKNIAERVRMLGGKIKLDSEPDKGTRIEITIPISAEHG